MWTLAFPCIDEERVARRVGMVDGDYRSNARMPPDATVTDQPANTIDSIDEVPRVTDPAAVSKETSDEQCVKNRPR